MSKWLIELKKEVTELIGMSIHSALRTITNSKEAITAYNAIFDMPDDEWINVCEAVFETINKMIP